MHDDDPFTWEYFPAVHRVHAAELLTVEKLPGSHGMQLPFLALHVPGRQSFMGKQKVDPGPRVVQPSKHEVQFEAPVELEKVPTGQSTQFEAPAVTDSEVTPSMPQRCMHVNHCGAQR